MNIYLDDCRDPKSNFIEDAVWVRTATKTIELLKTGEVATLDLDYDLAYAPMMCGFKETGEVWDNLDGLDVLLWLEQEIKDNPKFKLPEIYLHSAHPEGRKKMMKKLTEINKLIVENNK